MIRAFLLLALALIAAPAVAQPAGRMSELPRLKAAVTVSRDVVRIGDLIENAGELGDIPVFRAPDPGSTGSVPAERVLEVARAHNLLLVDAAGLDQVEVTRVSRAIERPQIEERIRRTFASQFGPGDADRLALAFDREPQTLHVEPQAMGDLQVARASYDPRSRRFDALFFVPATDAAQRPMVRYTGAIVETEPAVVLTRPLGRGEIVRASDVIVERRPKTEITSDTVTTLKEAIGRAARQPLRAGPPLRRTELVKVEIIKRDEAVTLIYEVPGIVLTVRGKAQEAGAEGDLINVLNVQSKRAIQGVVTGPGRVSVASATPISVAETTGVSTAGSASKSE